jgi:predicted outer membrane repeat protein
MKPTAKIIVISALLAFCGTSLANELLVPSQYPAIQSAIDAAVDGDTVIVAPGTYTGSGNRDITFKGKAITVRSADPNDPCVVAATIIDCQADANNRHRGFKFVTGEDVNSILSGITIISGNAPDENVLGEIQNVGGAVFCYESSPTVMKCTMTNNSAVRGGAIFCCMSTGIIKDCAFTSNSADYHGGAVYCRQSHVIVRNSTFKLNSAIYYGGAIYSYNGQDEIRECNVVSNNGGYGAGIAANQGETEIVDCIILNNNGERGGGICCGSVSAAQTNSPLVQRCLISGNIASTRGGGINVGNNAIIKDCVVTHNQGVNGGGVGFLYSTTPLMTNSIIAGNTRYYGPLGEGGGGGVSIEHGSRAAVVNCTIANNETAEYGGGIDVYISTPLVANCIIWNNGAEWAGNTIGRQIVVRGNFITGDIADLTLRFCDIEGGLADIKLQYEGKIGLALGNIDADPCFVDDANDDYHLKLASPCINAGDPNYVPEPNDTDIDGLPRVIGGRIDMGAFEFNHQPVAVAGPNQVVYAWLDGFADVNLDGSASFDDDNDVLDFYWSWTIAGNTYEVNGVNPKIQLPVGKHTIEFVVDDGIDLSEPDYCTITVIKAVRGKLMISPRVIETKSCGRWILASLFIPPVPGEKVNANEPLRLYPGGVEAKYQRFSKLGKFGCAPTFALAYFDKQQVIDALGPGQFDVIVVGRFTSGRFFFGSDTIRIISPPPPRPKPPFFWH